MLTVDARCFRKMSRIKVRLCLHNGGLKEPDRSSSIEKKNLVPNEKCLRMLVLFVCWSTKKKEKGEK